MYSYNNSFIKKIISVLFLLITILGFFYLCCSYKSNNTRKNQSPFSLEEKQKKSVNARFYKCKSDGVTSVKSICHFVETYPNEIFIGDSIFVTIKAKNLSDSPIVYGSCILHYTLLIADFDNDLCMEKLKSYQDDVNAYYDDIKNNKLFPIITPQRMEGIGIPFKIEPNSTIIEDRYRFEIPYLNQWGEPYWRQMIQTLPKQGIRLNLLLFIREYEELALIPITIKPRPDSEMKLLDNWYNNLNSIGIGIPSQTCSEYEFEFPIDTTCSFIKLRGNNWFYKPYKLNLFCSHEQGFFKPSIINAPATIQGWRDLESSLAPSTMRDEIQITRMILEYYNSNENEQDKKLLEIETWLKSLPPVQSSFFAKRYILIDDPFFKNSSQKLKSVLDRFNPTLSSVNGNEQ